MGVTVPNTQTRIVDPLTGADVGIGEEGEIWVSGPQVMKGYLNNLQATAAMIDSDGWLRTGDLGHVDADGHLYVVDRLKKLIKYKGFQVPRPNWRQSCSAIRTSPTPRWSGCPTRRQARFRPGT